MSASTVVHNFCSVACCISNCGHNTHHQFHSPNSLLRLKKQTFLTNIYFKSSRTQKPRSSFVVSAAQSNFVKVLQNAWKVGRDGIEAGTNLVPNSVPRPIARISVTIVALSVTLFVLKAFLSTAFFILLSCSCILVKAIFAYYRRLNIERDTETGRQTERS
uniref:Transmembrane protein n=1 Tax=Glycine max TaxID=3847 RepID=K7MSZ2_SOYBN